MKSPLMKILGMACAVIPFTLFAQTPQLVPLNTFGSNGDGSIRPGERSYLTDTNTFQRGMAFNPSTGNLIIANRSPVSAPTLNLVDGTTGEDRGSIPYNLSDEAGNANFPLNKVGVADDGAIYVANLTSASTATIGYLLYRYENEAASQTRVFLGDPSNGAATSSQSNGRWGDTMAVRGAGTNTQVLIASQGTLVAILRPTDETMTSFTATTLTTTVPSGSFADSICFGEGDTFWGKSATGSLRRMGFDLVAGTATVLNSYPSTVFPTRIGPMHNLISSNLFAGIEVVPGADLVKLYDVSNLSTNPVFLDHAPFQTTFANALGAGAVCSGNGKLYALDTDNGIMAFNIALSSDPVPPTFFLNPVGGVFVVGSNITLNAVADGVPTPTYQWYFNATNVILNATNSALTLTNAQTTDSGAYTAIAVNNVGAATTTATVTVLPASVLYLYEPFNYTAGALLTGSTLAPGQVWYLNGTTTDDNRIASGSLNVTGLSAAAGNSFTNGAGGPAARLPMGVAQNNDSIYVSFAMRMNAIGTSFTGTGLMASFVNDPANDQVSRLLVQKNGSGYSIGVAKVTTSLASYSPTVFNEGETVFVVMRYTWVTGGTTNDQVSLWLNPDPSTFGAADAPAPTANAPLGGTDVAAINGMAFRQNSSANTPQNVNYDELRIANKWSLVTPAPVIDVPISLSIQKSGTDVVLSWPTSGSTGFALQSAANLNTPVQWTNVAEPVVVQGSNNTVTISAANGQTYYRLLK